MVSTLWSVCAEGDLEKVAEVLNQHGEVHLEARDHNGNTPLIEAVRNGRTEVVRMLLDKGADPTNASSQGPPEQYTSDPAIIELLTSARNKIASRGATEAAYTQDSNIDPSKTYYPPPPGPYYYPGMHMPPPMVPDGTMPFYPPPPPHAQMPDLNGNAFGNLPPPEIARMIPCRYYPACRYGPSCMFAHPAPPQAPYLPGPLPPPAQYPAPYDPMSPAPYPPTYYPVQSPSFQQAPVPPPANPMSPTLSTNVPPAVPTQPPVAPRPGPEMVSPVQAHYPPGGIPPPMPYGVPAPGPYGPPGPVPMPGPQPVPAQSPQAMYPPTSPIASTVPPYPVPQGYMAQPYPPPPMPSNGAPMESLASPRSPTAGAQPDFYISAHRESFSHHKRGAGRRPSFGGSRKPPCRFFPSGRCKNGDDCRFPHVMPDGSMPHNSDQFSGRGGHRSRPSFHANGATGLEEKFASLNTQEHEQPPPEARLVTNGVNGTNGISAGTASNGSSRSQSTEPGSRGRGFQGYKNNQFANGHRADKKPVIQKPQRLPSADEFPVLAGSATPPLRSPGSASLNGWSGPTAAQVLQAPAPARKESQPGTRGGSPENGRPPAQSAPAPAKEIKAESNGTATTTSPASPAQTSASKLPVSFAAAAAPEAAKEVAVAA